MDVAFKVNNAREARKIKRDMVFLEAGWGGQRRKQNPKGRRSGALGVNQLPIARRRVIGGMNAQNSKGKIEMRTLTEKCRKRKGSRMTN